MSDNWLSRPEDANYKVVVGGPRINLTFTTDPHQAQESYDQVLLEV